jgi:hypothetical protein
MQRMQRIRSHDNPFLALPQVAPYDRLVLPELQYTAGDSSDDHRGIEVRAR